MSATQPCAICQTIKALRPCGLCQREVCKQHGVAMPPDAFAFRAKIAVDLSHNHYCIDCFEQKVAAEKEAYDTLFEQAKEVIFLSKEYPGHVRVLRRHTKRVSVTDCDDRRETILRLAFFAAELGMNAIIEAKLESAKTRNGGYQSMTWSGSAMPANVDEAQLERSSLKRI